MPINDDILQRLKTIEEAVTNNQTIDWEQVRVDFEKTHKAYIDAQIQEKLDSRPMRRVPGALVGPDGTKIERSNRYHKYLSAFEKDGYRQSGNVKVLPLDLYLAQRMMTQAKTFFPEKVRAAPSGDLEAAVKAMTGTSVGAGDEYVPTDMAETVWMDLFLAARIAGTIMTIDMPSDPFDVPIGLGGITWRKGTRTQQTTPQDPTTAKATLTSTEQIAEVDWDYTLDEDAVVAIMPLIRAEITRSGAEQIDSFALNADSTDAATGNINSDDGNPANDNYYLSDGQDGLRHLWLVDNTAQNVDAGGDALADADILNVLGKLDKYAAQPDRNVFTCDVQTYLKGFLKTGSGTVGENVITIDKFGPSAVVLTGQLAAYRGVPIVPSSQYLRAEADGKRSVTEANNTLGSITAYHRDMWKLGFRRQLLIEIDKEIRNRLMYLVSSFRIAVAARGPRSSATHTAGVRNILLT
jgi:HK97 family phage major capsid protein